MMKLTLSLSSNRRLWALSDPGMPRSYIHPEKKIGSQEHLLIFTEKDPGPKEIDLEEYPEWARRMILSSINSGELLSLASEKRIGEEGQEPAELPKKAGRPKSKKQKG